MAQQAQTLVEQICSVICVMFSTCTSQLCNAYGQCFMASVFERNHKAKMDRDKVFYGVNLRAAGASSSTRST